MDQRELLIVDSPLDDLVDALRAEAALLRCWGAEAQAVAADYVVARIEEAWSEWHAEQLTVAQAAAESGYSEPHLRRLLAESRIENAGSEGRPRIRRGDLPRKHARNSAADVDLADEVLRARDRDGL